ncbi:MerR family transcriptional regulator [bacterium]|nr:MerR family transcriptional regulator [bacterium]
MEINIPDKLFFSIGEVSRLTKVESYVLRDWEGEFKQLKPQKDGDGKRSYTKKDIELILQIKKLLWEDLYTRDGAKKQLEAPKNGLKKSHDHELVNIIKDINKELTDIRAILNR